MTMQPSSTARNNLFDDWFGPKKKPSSPATAAPPPPVPPPASVVENKQETPPNEEPVVVSAVVTKETEPVVVAEKQKPPGAEQPVVEEEEKQVTNPVAELKEQVAPVFEVKKEEQETPKVEHLDDDTSPDAIHKGKVRWYNQQKGYGFLECADGRPDVFVHQSAIHKDGFRSLLKEEEVEFRLVQDVKGRYRAVDVTGPGGKQVIGVR
jgi:cold shock CspA family protein